MPRLRFLRRGLASLVLLTAHAASLGSQETAPGRFGEEIEVSEALIDVLVTDRDGNVVLGLAPSDFRVTVEGRPAEVTGATFSSNRRYLDAHGATRLGASTVPIPDRRWFVIFIDDQKIEGLEYRPLLTRQLDAGRELADWLRRELLPNDYVAVVSFDSRLRLHQDFSNDLEALVAAVGAAARGEVGTKEWPSRREPSSDLPSLAAALGDAKALAKRTPEIHRAITALAEALRDVPGRTNLVLFTGGFGDVGTVGQYRPDPRYDRAMIEALNAANVAVYAVDVVPPGTRHPLENSVSHIADATGGLPFLDVIRFGVPLERVARETNGYYLVSVRAEGAGASFRDVRVEVANPEFRVRSRRGYRFEPVG